MPIDNAAPPIIAGRQARAVPLYRSSVGQKIFAALTGLFLCSFLIVHLSGNLLLFRDDSGKAFDTYSEFMSTNTAIRTMEIVLFAGFLIHVLFAVTLWITNRMARPRRYAMTRPSENSTLESRTAFISGSVIFIFLVVHLRTFFVPVRFASGVKPSMYEMVAAAFSNPVYDGFYLVALALLGYHLRHGFQSAFQTFGLRPSLKKWIDLVAVVFWLIVPIGFAAMPLYFYWAYLKGVR